MFSFVPAKQVCGTPAAFERPNIEQFVSPGLNCNFRDCLGSDAQAKEVKVAWVRIAQRILGGGLVLGTAFQIPNGSHST